jgi:hypothetical protein
MRWFFFVFSLFKFTELVKIGMIVFKHNYYAFIQYGVSFLTNEEHTEALIATVAKIFAYEGAAKLVAILANSIAEIIETDSNNYNGGYSGYTLYLRLELSVYVQISSEKVELENSICMKLSSIFDNERNTLRNVVITPQLTKDDAWRDKAKVWAKSGNINNQGKVRSDNIASIECDGLLFRSQPEITLYKALKSLGISFAPLPVFIRGGEAYKRIEPDFLIVKNGVMMMIEVDGDTVHEETPAEAHARTTMLIHEGVHLERFKASECDTEEKARSVAQRIIEIIDKHKNAR